MKVESLTILKVMASVKSVFQKVTLIFDLDLDRCS